MVNSLVFRIDHLKGLYRLYIALYSISVALYALYAISRTSEGSAPAVTPLLFLLFFGTNPIFPRLWFSPIADKVWFAFFMLALLLLQHRPYAVTVLLGLLAATQGLGIPIMALYVLHLWVNQGVSRQQILQLLLVFGVILALSHLPWFPDWRNGYLWRADRQTAIAHDTLFMPLGLDESSLPLVLTSVSLLLLAVLVAARRLVLEEVFLLPVVASILFGGEAPFNRLLVIILAMLLLTPHNRTILISYLLGAFLSLTSMRMFPWIIMWGWILYLLVETGLDIFRRNARSSAAAETSWVKSSLNAT